ncbi:hypothetical protein [Chondrinema litorale]|uniref:hypothetical protein n=1 Tax=Chondrinema litorale TaxID=2994555 RepID=UPI002542F433|nr:hypothetical protein [Chondrinema litorale]UZS00236.1 hypothetical protein OQ292_40560 [Chondrinema litorale]
MNDTSLKIIAIKTAIKHVKKGEFIHDVIDIAKDIYNFIKTEKGDLKEVDIPNFIPGGLTPGGFVSNGTIDKEKISFKSNIPKEIQEFRKTRLEGERFNPIQHIEDQKFHYIRNCVNDFIDLFKDTGITSIYYDKKRGDFTITYAPPITTEIISEEDFTRFVMEIQTARDIKKPVNLAGFAAGLAKQGLTSSKEGKEAIESTDKIKDITYDPSKHRQDIINALHAGVKEMSNIAKLINKSIDELCKSKLKK